MSRASIIYAIFFPLGFYILKGLGGEKEYTAQAISGPQILKYLLFYCFQGKFADP